VLFELENPHDPWETAGSESEFGSEYEYEAEYEAEFEFESGARVASEWEAQDRAVPPALLDEEYVPSPWFVDWAGEGARRGLRPEARPVLSWALQIVPGERAVWEGREEVLGDESEGGDGDEGVPSEGEGEGEVGEEGAERPWHEGLSLEECFAEANRRWPAKEW
jgi:hypothetical protein